MITLTHAVPAADVRLSDAVIQTLRHSPYGALRALSCQANGGVVTLRGRLPSFYLKQIAQTLVYTVSGVRQVCNDIEVTD